MPGCMNITYTFNHSRNDSITNLYDILGSKHFSCTCVKGKQQPGCSDDNHNQQAQRTNIETEDRTARKHFRAAQTERRGCELWTKQERKSSGIDHNNNGHTIIVKNTLKSDDSFAYRSVRMMFMSLFVFTLVLILSTRCSLHKLSLIYTIHMNMYIHICRCLCVSVSMFGSYRRAAYI